MSRTESHRAIAPWVRTILIFPAYVFIVGMFQWIGYLIVGLDFYDFQYVKTTFEYFIVSIFTLIGTIITVGIFRRYIDEESFESMGFKLKNIRTELYSGLFMGAFIIASGFLALLAIQEIKISSIQVEVNNMIWGTALFIFIAVAEELILRGYILNNLMKSMNRWIALPVSALMFSLGHILNSHLSWIGFCNLTLAGILLGLPYIYTKSLWLPIALHFSWNYFQGSIFGFNVSGHVTYSLFTQSRTADTIWNGGKFGFEGSVLCLVFQTIAILALWWYYSKKSEQYELSRIPVYDHPLKYTSREC
jgi:membrane protease YdiL (CAAX protease family)